MLTQVDHVIVADNMSTDGTRDILDSLPVEVVEDNDPAYYQSAKMTHLARLAYLRGADWVVPFDADELWVSGCKDTTVKQTLEQAEGDYGIVTADLYDHVATAVDPVCGDIVDRLPWRRRHHLPLPKVAVRAHPAMVIEQGNHWARLPIPPRYTQTAQLVCHHYPYRTPEQVIRKVRNGAAAYAATTGLPAEVGAHWRGWATWSDDQIRDLFRIWYFREDPIAPYTVPGTDPPEVHDPLIWDNPPRVR